MQEDPNNVARPIYLPDYDERRDIMLAEAAADVGAVQEAWEATWSTAPLERVKELFNLLRMCSVSTDANSTADTADQFMAGWLDADGEVYWREKHRQLLLEYIPQCHNQGMGEVYGRLAPAVYSFSAADLGNDTGPQPGVRAAVCGTQDERAMQPCSHRPLL